MKVGDLVRMRGWALRCVGGRPGCGVVLEITTNPAFEKEGDPRFPPHARVRWMQGDTKPWGYSINGLEVAE